MQSRNCKRITKGRQQSWRPLVHSLFQDCFDSAYTGRGGFLFDNLKFALYLTEVLNVWPTTKLARVHSSFRTSHCVNFYFVGITLPKTCFNSWISLRFLLRHHRNTHFPTFF